LALRVHRGSTDFQVRESPFKIQLEPKFYAWKQAPGEFGRLSFSADSRGEGSDLLSIEEQPVRGPFGFNHESVVASHD
jgi:hypothetical protein